MGGIPPGNSAETPTSSQIKELQRAVDEWSQTEAVQSFEDGSGCFCIKVDTPRKVVYATAKSYIYKELASFSQRVIKRAIENNQPVAIFFDCSPPRLGNAYVFDPHLIRSDGNENIRSQGTDTERIWIDINLEDGVLFGDYITDHADIPTDPTLNNNREYDWNDAPDD